MIQTAKELAALAKRVATEFKTVYVMGCFGAPMTEKNKARYLREQAYNQQPHRQPRIQAATADTFGFDCVCFIKGLLWDWEGNPSSVYGGADYAINGVPDIDTERMLCVCSEVSDDFREMEIGEYLWMPGHCGLYLGDGLAVEATPEWADGVQISAVGQIGPVKGYPTRTWVKHGKLPYVQYIPEDESQEPEREPESAELFLVWAGAFTGKKEAEAFARELAAAGPFTPVISKVKEVPAGEALPDEVPEAPKPAPAPAPEPDTIEEGDTVRIREGATDYKGTVLWDALFKRDHKVHEVNGDRAVISYNGTVVAAMRVGDLIKV